MKVMIFLLIDFLPMIVFLLVESFFSEKEAMLASIIAILIFFLIYKINKILISKIFYLISGLTIIFGIIDILSGGSPFLLKYESVITNFVTGLFFLLSIKNNGSIIQDFAIKQKRFSEEHLSYEMIKFFKIWTLIWIIYFFMKSLLYFWIANEYSYKDGFLIRLIVGNVSFYTLLFLSIFGGNLSYRVFKSLGLLKVNECS